MLSSELEDLKQSKSDGGGGGERERESYSLHKDLLVRR